jgi:hypothetical protein
MELLYIWLNKYKNISKRGFDLSGEYLFEYNDKKKELSIEDNPEYLPGFFNVPSSNSNIANINSLMYIIGGNGSGKTSLLDFIKDNLPSKQGGIKTEAVIVMKINSALLIYCHKSLGLLKIINNVTDRKQKTKIKYYTEQTQPAFTVYEDIPEITDTTFIYLSNIFDNRKEYFGDFSSNLLNVSTNYLVHKDYNDYYYKHLGSLSGMEEQISVKYESNQIIVHNIYEVKRQLFFCKDIEEIALPFKLPNSLIFSFDNLNFDKIFAKSIDLGIRDTFMANMKALSDKLDKVINSNISQKGDTSHIDFTVFDKKAIVKALICKSVFINFLENASAFYFMFKMNFPGLDFEIDNVDIIDSLIKFFEKLIKGHVYFESIESRQKDKTNKLFKSNIEFLKFTKEYIENYKAINHSLFSKQGNIKYSDTFKFFDLYLDTYPKIDYINVEWSWNISSGENAFLNIFSRMYELIKGNVNKYEAIKKDIVLMIDEGDLYMHPQWGKEYVYNLLMFVQNVFPRINNNYQINVQLILTSNSPIIISDIPRNHIVFLRKNEFGLCEVVKHLEDRKQTFSSNIHQLFSDAFFMNDGLIGEFAKLKINNVIKDLERTTKLSAERIDEIEGIISIVGEPIIKRKLLQMFEDKYSLTLRERISNLEKEILLLKKGRNNDKD